jgi:aspartate/methionine/tyrosine aminotransferase
MMSALKSVVSETFSAVSATVQYAGLKAYRDFEELQPFIEKTTDIYRYVTNYLYRRFVEIGLNCPHPMGSFYLFLDFERFRSRLKKRGIITAAALAEALLAESGIAVLPGSDFYLPATNLGVRVAAVDFDGAAALETWPGSENVTDEYFRQAFPKMEQGCERIKGFLDRLDHA